VGNLLIAGSISSDITEIKNEAIVVISVEMIAIAFLLINMSVFSFYLIVLSFLYLTTHKTFSKLKAINK